MVWVGAAEEFGASLDARGWEGRVERFTSVDAVDGIFVRVTGAGVCVFDGEELATERFEVLAWLGDGWTFPFSFAD